VSADSRLDRAGLSSEEAARRLQRYGPNEIADRDRKSFARTLRTILTEPMFALLLVAAAVYLLVGDLAEGLLLAAFACVTVGLVVFQERRSERALEALRDLAVPHVRVIRDGSLRRLPARELVPGDAFRVAEGERVGADAVLRDASGLSIEGGRLGGGLDRMAVSGNVADLLMSVEAVATDLAFLVQGGGSTVLLRAISVGGAGA